jgi:glycosyltransferase involved in cell wall biosynthesis
MKIIGITPIKNESPFIDSFASSLSKVCDKIIVLDDNSTDDSITLLKKYDKVDIVNFENNNNWGSKRGYLFNMARDYGATHIVALDADEAFTSNAIENFDIITSAINEGQRCTLHWLPMWKSLYDYRDDNSVWSNSYKDFIICDDGKMSYNGNWIHEPRLPIVSPTKQITSNVGGVFHFQFSSWEAFQIKQSWYRCLERVENPNKSVHEINNTYSITLDDTNCLTTNAPSEWYKDVILPDLNNVYNNTTWRLNQIKDWFNTYSVDFFKDLDIWHVNEIKNIIK